MPARRDDQTHSQQPAASSQQQAASGKRQPNGNQPGNWKQKAQRVGPL
jgi:hypothetical protein